MLAAGFPYNSRRPGKFSDFFGHRLASPTSTLLLTGALSDQLASCCMVTAADAVCNAAVGKQLRCRGRVSRCRTKPFSVDVVIGLPKYFFRFGSSACSTWPGSASRLSPHRLHLNIRSTGHSTEWKARTYAEPHNINQM